MDYAPEEANVRYTRSSWNEVYTEYVKSCQNLEAGSVTYPFSRDLGETK